MTTPLSTILPRLHGDATALPGTGEPLEDAAWEDALRELREPEEIAATADGDRFDAGRRLAGNSAGGHHNRGKAMFRVGESVVVYEDPAHCKRVEGTAEIVQRIRRLPGDYGGDLHLYKVRFPEAPEPDRIYQRAIVSHRSGERG